MAGQNLSLFPDKVFRKYRRDTPPRLLICVICRAIYHPASPHAFACSAPCRLLARFWKHVQKTETCWLWDGTRDDKGYGTLKDNDNNKTWRVHRFAYFLLVGPVPDGLVLDHLCRTPLCVNPAHLEPVTQLENIRRGQTEAVRNKTKTHCDHGHLFDATNTIVMPDGYRQCRACKRRRGLAWYYRNRAAGVVGHGNDAPTIDQTTEARSPS